MGFFGLFTLPLTDEITPSQKHLDPKKGEIFKKEFNKINLFY